MCFFGWFFYYGGHKVQGSVLMKLFFVFLSSLCCLSLFGGSYFTTLSPLPGSKSVAYSARASNSLVSSIFFNSDSDSSRTVTLSGTVDLGAFYVIHYSTGE